MHRSAERPRGGVSPAFLLLLLFFFSLFFSLNDGFPWSGENLVSPLKIDGREGTLCLSGQRRTWTLRDGREACTRRVFTLIFALQIKYWPP